MTFRNLLILGVAALALAACKTAPSPQMEVARFAPCEDVSVAIYFTPASSAISREGKAVLRGAATQAKGCTIDRIDVNGLADSVGSPEANMRLSEKRAAMVTKTLNGFGLKGIRVTASGDSGALTPAGAADPLRRRAEVILRLSAPGV